MRSTLVLIWVSAACLAACNADICHKAVSVANAQLSQLAACNQGFNLDGGATSDQEVQSCESRLSSCTASDQAALNADLDCLSSLPTLQCKWLTDAANGIEDADYTTYLADLQVCNAKTPSGLPGQAPALSPGCLNSQSTGGTNGGSTTGGGSTSGGTTTGGGMLGWPGTYAVQANSTFVNAVNGQSQTLSGTETITESDTSITIAGFANPVLSCSLTLTLPFSSSTNASLPTSQPCGSYTIIGGVQAYLSGLAGSAAIDINGSAEDSTGSASAYTFTVHLAQQ